jgi:hypothetical protein
MATLNYGWESAVFYGKWGLPDEEAAGVSLEPYGEQSDYAVAFLDYFEEVLLADEAYRQRLIRHYFEFKATLVSTATGGNSRARRAARRRAERSLNKRAA